MNRHIRFALFFVTLAFSHCLYGFAQSKLPQVKDEEKLPPVRISASETTLAASGKSTLTLTLHIQPGVAIYTNDPYEVEPEFDYLLPTKIELLDSNGKPVETEFQFPRGTLTQGGMGGTYMYTDSVSITASFTADVAVEKLSFAYHGYRFSDNVLEYGYC